MTYAALVLANLGYVEGHAAPVGQSVSLVHPQRPSMQRPQPSSSQSASDSHSKGSLMPLDSQYICPSEDPVQACVGEQSRSLAHSSSQRYSRSTSRHSAPLNAAWHSASPVHGTASHTPPSHAKLYGNGPGQTTPGGNSSGGPQQSTSASHAGWQTFGLGRSPLDPVSAELPADVDDVDALLDSASLVPGDPDPLTSASAEPSLSEDVGDPSLLPEHASRMSIPGAQQLGRPWPVECRLAARRSIVALPSLLQDVDENLELALAFVFA